jgi:hypothetical protein
VDDRPQRPNCFRGIEHRDHLSLARNVSSDKLCLSADLPSHPLAIRRWQIDDDDMRTLPRQQLGRRAPQP